MRVGDFVFEVTIVVSMAFVATLIVFTFTYAVAGPIKTSQGSPNQVLPNQGLPGTTATAAELR